MGSQMGQMRFVLIFILVCAYQSCIEEELNWPEKSWRQLTGSQILAQNWNASLLAKATKHSAENGSMGWMLIENGLVVATFGNDSTTFIVQSVRKSFLSALYGIQVTNHLINLNWNLAKLEIDDHPDSLDANEKKATIQHLLQSRSGIYHLAASSPEHMISNLPQRGQFIPGQKWYYNNWDFNALGTIYMNVTGEDLFESFAKRVATPLGMQDFIAGNCYYKIDSVSIHPAYHFSMSMRDMARFGLLYLRNGNWQDKEIISPKWIEESTKAHTLNRREGYGYMWWIEPQLNSFSARGGSGQLIMVIPDRDIVFVHCVDRHSPEAAVWSDVEDLLRIILEAKSR